MHTDRDAIEALIRAQFAALSWAPGSVPDYRPLLDGFLADAKLYPSRRPLAPQTPAAFCSRLDGLRTSGALTRFSERVSGLEVAIFGRVAVAMAGCEMLENDDTVTRDVSAFLLVKDDEGWWIAAQAWDVERPDLTISARLGLESA